jgi:ABC-type sugar transport system permease subunit
MIIVLAGIMSIPDSFYEAATIDGANVFQQEFYITIPMIRGILVTVITLAVSYGLRHFEATFLMTQGGPPILRRSWALCCTRISPTWIMVKAMPLAPSWFWLVWYSS